MLEFQPTRLSRASTKNDRKERMYEKFQPTRLSRASTKDLPSRQDAFTDFNPQGSREPRRFDSSKCCIAVLFQPTRLSRASTASKCTIALGVKFQPTRLSRASTAKLSNNPSSSPPNFYASCPPLLISTSLIHSPSPFSRHFRCFSGANLPGISC